MRLGKRGREKEKREGHGFKVQADYLRRRLQIGSMLDGITKFPVDRRWDCLMLLISGIAMTGALLFLSALTIEARLMFFSSYLLSRASSGSMTSSSLNSLSTVKKRGEKKKDPMSMGFFQITSSLPKEDERLHIFSTGQNLSICDEVAYSLPQRTSAYSHLSRIQVDSSHPTHCKTMESMI